MNWLHYLVEANIYLGVFYLCYCLFLNKETHYALGRAYLLFCCVAAFTLPVMQVSILKPVEPATQNIVYIPATPGSVPVQQITIEEPAKYFALTDGLFYIYFIGAGVTLILLSYRLYRLFLLARNRQKLAGKTYKIIQLGAITPLSHSLIICLLAPKCSKPIPSSPTNWYTSGKSIQRILFLWSC